MFIGPFGLKLSPKHDLELWTSCVCVCARVHAYVCSNVSTLLY